MLALFLPWFPPGDGTKAVCAVVAQLLKAMTALARHAVRTRLRANSYFEPSGLTVQVPSKAQHDSPTNIPVNNSYHLSEPAAPAGPGFNSRADANLPLSHVTLLTCPGVQSEVAPSSQFAFQLSPKEALASLQTFGRGSDKLASVLDHDSFIEFQVWFSASLWKRSAAGVPATAHAALLAQKVTCSLQKLFIREQDSAPVDIAMLSANHLCSRLSDFYQDASVRFSDAVLTMHFRKDHLAADLAKLRTYPLHSHFVSTLDGNDWIYRKLRNKMQAAWPQCLLLAGTGTMETVEYVYRETSPGRSSARGMGVPGRVCGVSQALTAWEPSQPADISREAFFPGYIRPTAKRKRITLKLALESS
jgi:hypothetical protein